MDMLVLFMLFCSIPPFVLWKSRRNWALIQLPLLIGMWASFTLSLLSIEVAEPLHALLLIAFYGNLIYTEAAIIRYCIDIGNQWKMRTHP